MAYDLTLQPLRRGSPQALALWPRNGELVAMLAAAGEAARGAARLRGDLAAACAAGPAPAAWLLALRSEALRPGAAVHLQPLFERLVGGREGGTCPLLWRCYLAYERGRDRPQVAAHYFPLAPALDVLCVWGGGRKGGGGCYRCQAALFWQQHSAIGCTLRSLSFCRC